MLIGVKVQFVGGTAATVRCWSTQVPCRNCNMLVNLDATVWGGLRWELHVEHIKGRSVAC